MLGRLAKLLRELEFKTDLEGEVEALDAFLRDLDEPSRRAGVNLLLGQSFEPVVEVNELRESIEARFLIPRWLSDICFDTVGDEAEALALLFDTHRKSAASAGEPLTLADWLSTRVEALRQINDPTERIRRVWQSWDELDLASIRLFNALILGEPITKLRRELLAAALARQTGVAAPILLIRFKKAQGSLDLELASAAPTEVEMLLAPLSFHTTEELHDCTALGDCADFYFEHKVAGQRVQIVRNGKEIWCWDRNFNLMKVGPASFAKTLIALPEHHLFEGLLHNGELTIVDLLREPSSSLEHEPFERRRARLEELASPTLGKNVRLAQNLKINSHASLLEMREGCRASRAQGILAKRRSARRGEAESSFAFLPAPLTVRAVLLYAGRELRGGFADSEYTFGVWQNSRLVPVARVMGGLSAPETEELERWIRQNTIERFGPVRSLPAEQVFELDFDDVEASRRHKAGLILKNARIREWNPQMPARKAAKLDELLKRIEL